MPRRSSPETRSLPVSPPTKPIHTGVRPSVCKTMATCAAFPPARAQELFTRCIFPGSSSFTRTRVSIAGFGLTQRNIVVASELILSRHEGGGRDFFKPWMRCGQGGIDVLNVADAVHLEPVLQGGKTALHKNRDTVFPGSSAAEHAGKSHA